MEMAIAIVAVVATVACEMMAMGGSARCDDGSNNARCDRGSSRSRGDRAGLRGDGARLRGDGRLSIES